MNWNWIGCRFAEMWPFEIFKISAGRDFGFGPTRNNAVRTADLKTRTKSKMDPVTFCGPFEFFGRSSDRGRWSSVVCRIGLLLYAKRYYVRNRAYEEQEIYLSMD